MQLLRFFTISAVTSHWMACIWCFVATYAQERNPEYDKTWRDALADGKLTGISTPIRSLPHTWRRVTLPS